MEHSTACVDWEDRIRRGASIIPPPIFPERAAEALSVFKQLRLVDVAGSPTFGEASGEWAFEFVAAIFGAYDADTGRSLIKEAFLNIPKKNMKSTLAAGIMVTAMVINWRRGAEMTILAPSLRVAQNSFKPAHGMIEASPQLSRMFDVSPYERLITHRTMKSQLRILSAENDTVSGSKASFVLIDEMWLFGTKAKAPSMMREAVGGLAARPEGFVIKLSTQSSDVPAGVFKEDLQLYRDIRDGIVKDNSKLPVLYEHPRAMVEDGSASLLENLGMVNPNLGRSVDPIFLEQQYATAGRKGPTELRDFLAKHGNVELGMNLRSDRWAGADFWEAAGDASITLEELKRRSEVCVVGIDGGGLDDLLGLVVVGRCGTTGDWLVWAHAWAHSIVMTRRKDIAPNIRDFVRDGDLTIVEAPGEDVEALCDVIAGLEASGLLPAEDAIGVDTAGIGAIVSRLTSPEFGIEVDRIRGISQGYKLSGAIKTTERMVAGKTLRHGAQPLMAWAVGNAKVSTTGNAMMVTKQNSGSAKIDPLMALFDAVSLMALNPAGTGSMDSWLDSFST